jgi:type I restriction enzyme S subunit
MPNISTSAVRELEIHFPERDHQRVIVSMLTVYDELIENNLRRIEILEEMAQTIYREWFVNHRFPGHDQKSFVQSTIGPVPDGWRAAKFGDIAMEIRDGVHPSKLDPDTPYVVLEHIPRKSILLSEWGQPSDVSSRKWKYVEGDILFGKLRPYFHKVVWTPGMGVCSTDAIVIRPKDGFAEFALFIASSEEFVGHATSTAGGTDRPRANWIDLAAYPILLPTKRVLERFSEQIEPLVYLMLNLSNQSRNLSITRDLLLPKLISGEIDVSELDIDTSWLAA